MTMLDTAKDLQTRYLDGVKSAQEQIVSYNERIADSVSGALPDFQSPFASYLPTPTEVIDTYYTFLGDVQAANKDFASRMVAAWDRSEVAEKPAAKKATKK